jgi:hypothetical protein
LSFYLKLLTIFFYLIFSSKILFLRVYKSKVTCFVHYLEREAVFI